MTMTRIICVIIYSKIVNKTHKIPQKSESLHGTVDLF